MKIKIPRKYFEIRKEENKPTTYIMQRKTGLLQGRLEKGDKRKKKFRYGTLGRTRVVRIKKDFRGFKKGQIIARTKKTYPRQVNSILVRKGKMGKIKGVIVKEHKRKSKNRKVHNVKTHRRKK